MLKWIAAGLIILNVAVYLTIGGQTGRSQEERVPARPVVNEQAMLLLSEIPETASAVSVQPQDDSDPTPVRTSGIPGDSPDFPDTGTESPEQSVQTDLSDLPSVDDQDTQKPERMYTDEKLPASCFRIGPFNSEDSLEQASAWMADNRITHTPISGDSREFKAIRVFAGPFPDRTAVERYVRELEVKKIQLKARNQALEYYVYGNPQTGFRVSFGYFNQEKLATRYREDLQMLGIQAELATEYETMGPLYWMETSVTGDIVDLLKSRQWADEKIGIAPIDC